MFIKGVNLGGWLVLEKWIAGDMFLGTTAKDEHELYEQLSYEEISQRLQKHWDTFIQEKDILAIKQAGCTLMRLPVPYTLFGDVKGRIGCIEYVDTVFKWAEKYGVQILLDLHTVPGGQNALDNSGIMGLCTWHLKEENIRITLDVLEKLAQRYRNSQELFGIELLNEPVDEKMFKGIADGIEPEYKERILKSKPIDTEFLVSFYQEAYELLSPILKSDQKIVIHDGFRLGEWSLYFPKRNYPKLWIDTHMYLNFARYSLKDQSCKSYVDYIFDCFEKEIEEAEKYHPVIVGEWTLAHRAKEMPEMSKENRANYLCGTGCLQMMAFGKAHGWIYFNFRVEDETRKNWDFQYVVKNDLLPMK